MLGGSFDKVLYASGSKVKIAIKNLYTQDPNPNHLQLFSRDQLD